MADKTGIEWTDSTWNCIRGCTRVSRGCGGPGKQGGCYAEAIASRFSGPGQAFHGFATRENGWTGKLALIESLLTLPLRWKRPRRIFVNSMSDLFHEALSDSAIDRVFSVMALCPRHAFQVLTKRPERMRDYLTDEDAPNRIADAVCRIACSVEIAMDHALDFFRNGKIRKDRPVLADWPLPQVWLGTSTEDQETFDERWPHLRDTPAAVRFISYEPALGPLDLGDARPGWLICGSESGPRARPCDIEWVRNIRDQCAANGVAFFWKQFAVNGRKVPMPELDGRRWIDFPQVRP